MFEHSEESRHHVKNYMIGRCVLQQAKLNIAELLTALLCTH